MLVRVDRINSDSRRFAVLRKDRHKLSRQNFVTNLVGWTETNATPRNERLMDDLAAIGLDLAGKLE